MILPDPEERKELGRKNTYSEAKTGIDKQTNRNKIGTITISNRMFSYLSFWFSLIWLGTFLNNVFISFRSDAAGLYRVKYFSAQNHI